MSWFTNIFAGDGSSVYVRRDWSSTGYQYSLIQKLTTDLYLSMYLDGTLSIGGEFMRLGKMYANRLYRAHNKDSASLTLAGGWLHTAGNQYLGGYITYRHTTGAYAELTTGDGVTEVGCITLSNQTNTGVALVTIDGDNTLADLLPTAQDLVDAGTLANTVLVANGGTLNPTDRVWNLYNLSSAAAFQLFSSSLSAGVHTVRLTNTGYKQTASSSTQCMFTAFVEWGAGLFDPSVALYHLRPMYNIFTTGANPVWEISYSIIPTGAVGAEWIGHSGSLKFSSLPVILADEVRVAPAIGETYKAREFTFLMQFAVRHTETGATDLGYLDLYYHFDCIAGLTIGHTLTWSVGGTVEGYPCMMAVNSAIFDRCKSPDISVTVVSLGDGLFKCYSDDQEIWLWDYDGYLGAYMLIPDLSMTVNDWAESGSYKLFIQDHAAGWNKVYARRFEDRAYIPGEVWVSQANYRIKWFASGANKTIMDYYNPPPAPEPMGPRPRRKPIRYRY